MNVTVPVALLAVAVCSTSLRGEDPERVRLTWDSARVSAVERELDDLLGAFLVPAFPPDSDAAERRTKCIEQLRARLSPQDLRDLAVDVERIPIEWLRGQSLFQRLVVSEMVSAFLNDGDRDRLVLLLSKRCPPIYHHIEIELMLAIHGKKLKHPITILGDAYAKCDTPQVKKTIAQALRHAFEGSGVRARDDTEFVKLAMTWYDREKETLELNGRYGHMVGPAERFLLVPLFQKKTTK
jgi:hypothetical protein